MTAVTLVPGTNPLFGGWCGKTFVVTTGAAVMQLWCCYSVVVLFPGQQFGLLFGNHIVDASSLVYLFTNPWLQTLLKERLPGWCVV
jgi:hypothetical protein